MTRRIHRIRRNPSDQEEQADFRRLREARVLERLLDFDTPWVVQRWAARELWDSRDALAMTLAIREYAVVSSTL